MKMLIFVSMLFFNIVGFSQTIKYSYDAAGNRVLREIILSRQKSVESVKESEKPIEEKLSDKIIKIYPNPTKGELKIEVTNWDEKCTGNIYIYSSNGALIRQYSLDNPLHIVDISDEPVGFYILKIYLNENISTWRIIKE